VTLVPHDTTTQTDAQGGAGVSPGLVYPRISRETSSAPQDVDQRLPDLRDIGQRPPRAYLGCYPGGIRVHTGGVGPGAAAVGKGKRGIVSGFSPDSRRRMLARLAAIDWSAGPVFFTTLTFPDSEVGRPWEDYKNWLQLWMKRASYRFKGRLRGILWRQEWVPRKSGAHVGRLACHFHLCLFFDGRAPDLERLRAWVSQSWAEVVGSDDLRHARVGTRVSLARNVRGDKMGCLLAYVSKYAAKRATGCPVDAETGELVQTGRAWGIVGTLPLVRLGVLSMDWATYKAFLERVNEWGRATGSWYLSALSENWRGFLIMGDGRLLLDRLAEGLDVTWCARDGPADWLADGEGPC